ncbi:MAG: type II toxin-antitoxin system HicB family antitoxin [SAR324 cluster bacterium]|nr:type II toxin-antitoxin system HicB family antitoxin [SAR324 cluster bacterium]
MNKELYSIQVNWSDEDEGFIATVPEFPGLSAFGETRQEAVDEAQIVLEGFIEVYEEDSRKLPDPEKIAKYSGQTRLRIPKTLHQKIAQSAEREGVSMNQYINFLLSERESEKETFRAALEEAAEIFYKKAVLIHTTTFSVTSGNEQFSGKPLDFDQSSGSTYKEFRY